MAMEQFDLGQCVATYVLVIVMIRQHTVEVEIFARNLILLNSLMTLISEN